MTNDLVRACSINPIFDLLEIYRWAILGGDVSFVEVIGLLLWTVAFTFIFSSGKVNPPMEFDKKITFVDNVVVDYSYVDKHLTLRRCFCWIYRT